MAKSLRSENGLRGESILANPATEHREDIAVFSGIGAGSALDVAAWSKPMLGSGSPACRQPTGPYISTSKTGRLEQLRGENSRPIRKCSENRQKTVLPPPVRFGIMDCSQGKHPFGPGTGLMAESKGAA